MYVKYCKNKKIDSGPNNFFDSLSTHSMSCINTIFNNSIDNILISENIIKGGLYNPNTSKGNGGNQKIKIYFKLLDNALSIHDLYKNSSVRYYNKFLEKYKRKYNRFMDNIRSNEILYFIRSKKITQCEADVFKNFVYEINPNCTFFLICLAKDDADNINKEFITINLKKYEKSCKYDYDFSNIDWDKLFDYILLIK